MADHAPRATDHLEQMDFEAILYESQTDVTPSHKDGFSWARAAHNTALERQAGDESLGRAAIQATIRGALANRNDVGSWLEEAERRILQGKAVASRHVGALAIAGMRVRILAWYRDTDAPISAEHSAQLNALATEAVVDEDDRYWVMWTRWKALEAISQENSTEAARLAWHGLGLAIRSNREGQSLWRHSKFVARQARHNVGILRLVASTHVPVAKDWQWTKRHQGRLLYDLIGRPDMPAA